MAININIKKVLLWLIENQIIKNQKDLAQKIGCSPTSLSQIVSGKNIMTRNFAEKIVSLSKELNIDYLLGKSEHLLKIKQENNEEIDKIDKEDPTIQSLLKSISCLSTAIQKNIENDAIRAEAEVFRAEAEVINSQNIKDLTKLLDSEKEIQNKYRLKHIESDHYNKAVHI